MNISYKPLCISFIIVGLSGNVFPQDLPLDPAFLADLPPELTESLISNSEQRDKKVEPFRTPGSALQKINTTIERLDSELNSVKTDLLQRYSQSNNDLIIFGKQYFSSYQTSFAPVNIASYDPDYILDYGDKLTVQLVGTVNKVLDMHVERDGSIMLLQVGKIQVAGLTINKADEAIQARVAASQIGTKSYVSLSAKRDMNVLTIGAVEFPGMYTVSGGSSILQVLDAAGGISELGSYRNIELLRNNKVIEKIDLYKPLIEGKVIFKSQLRSGDVVSVKSRLPTIHVSGAVGYPAIYEISEGDTLKDILFYALGSTSGSTGTFEYYTRPSKTSNQILEKSIDLQSLSTIKPINGDQLFAPLFQPKPNKIRTVTISGEVMNPGQYSIRPGEKLSDLLARAGGYTEIAYPFGGILTRSTTKEIERQINERIYEDMIKFIASNANAAQIASGESFALILNEFRNVDPVGRVTAEFDLQKLNSNPQANLSLEDGDEIIIPEYDSEVYVLGEVLNPGARLYKPNNSGKDYIEISGGLGRYAEKNKSIIIHPNGDAFLLNDSYLSFVANKVDIYPGTIIYVPREIGKLEGINYAAVVAPIFSSLALSLASLNSINN